MKRLNNLYQQICSLENLQLANLKARKGKKNQYGIKIFDIQPEENLKELQRLLINKAYTTSPYTTFKIYEPKEREVYRLPYFPDRIGHHAVMNVLESMFTKMFTADTYSCIKGKGIHGAVKAVNKGLKDVAGTTYCLKLDIRKFYPSVNHDILKKLLRRKIKDRDLLWLLDEIIDSSTGLPIGNYLSQYFANFYLSYFDHWIKEVKGVKYYYRYADDIVILSDNKDCLHHLLAEIRNYLKQELDLDVKGNYQVFPVKSRGIDFVGYVFYHDYTLMRKEIKKSMARAFYRLKKLVRRKPKVIPKRKIAASIASYNGWATHCNSKHLLKKLTK